MTFKGGNVGSFCGRVTEMCEQLTMRKVNVCSLQEDGEARHRKSSGIGVVGTIVKEELREKV